MMKKIIFSLFCFLVVSVAVCAQTHTRSIGGESTKSSSDAPGKIFLKTTVSEKDSMKVYGSDELALAVERANPGDTIYLSSGTFSGNVSINKDIAIIGVGADESANNYTKYSGQLTFKSASATMQINNVLIEGVYFPYSYTSDYQYFSGIKSLTLRKCYFYNVNFGYYSDADNSHKLTVDKTILDRCYCENVYVYSDVESLLAKNCKLKSVGYGNNDSYFDKVRFNHCNIYSASLKAAYTNSMINELTSSLSSAMLVNVLYKKPSDDSSNAYSPNFQDCYEVDRDVLDNSLNSVFNDTELAQYNGYDGTVVGIDGGGNPFNLKRNVPVFTNDNVVVDPTTKEVTVNVKVTAN